MTINEIQSRSESITQRGFSLLELMIALALGGFLMLGLVNMFLSSRSSAQVETSLARVQENGRFALNLISQDILRSSYTGCNSVQGAVTVLATDAAFEGLRGYERSTSSWAPALATAELTTALNASGARVGSDVINLQTGRSLGKELLVADIGPSDASFDISDNPGGIIKQGDLVILSGCLTSHLLRVTNTPATAGATSIAYGLAGNDSSSVEPGYRYDNETELMLFQNVIWYVADTGRDKNGYDIWSLYRFDLDAPSGVADEMIEGVEYMQTLYGERAGSGAAGTTRFGTADTVTDWDNIVAIRIALLLQSYELVRNENDTNTYSMLGQTISNGSTPAHSGGRALRKVFSTTLALRNKPYDL
jgi:type IV pilus assembly protein PilW